MPAPDRTATQLLTASVLLEQALTILQTLQTDPETPPALAGTTTSQPLNESRHAQPPARIERPVRDGPTLLTDDEEQVLLVIDAGADHQNTYTRGQTALERDAHLGRTRLAAALATLRQPLTNARGATVRPQLLRVTPGPKGRRDYTLVVPDSERTLLD